MANAVICEKLSNIGKLTFNRPEVLNVCSRALASELTEGLNKFAADDDVKVIVVTGIGKAFMAGMDINVITEWCRLNDPVKIKDDLAQLLDTNIFEDCPKPTIAAVNGLAFGLGCEVAMACDFRIAVETAKFCLPEIKLGVVPGGGGSQRMLHLVGATRAMEIIATGDPIDAAEAYRIGLVNKVVPAEQLWDAVEAFVARLADKGALAMKTLKKLIYVGGDLPLRQGISYEKQLFSELLLSEDAAEGTKAFLEKRKPVFRGK